MNSTLHSSYTTYFQRYCAPQTQACCASRTNAAFCLGGFLFCTVGYSGSIQQRLSAEADFDIYDIRRRSTSVDSNTTAVVVASAHDIYLRDEDVRDKIGATRGNYTLLLDRGI